MQFAVVDNWQLPPDRGTVEPDVIRAILDNDDYPEATGYHKQIDYIDFESYGQSYTQVVITLKPDTPRFHNGRKLMVVGGEPGSEYAMDFLETPEGKEGPGIWLAKRGVTFVALTRVGRWNFLCKDETGSWEDIPLEIRMPIFNRHQERPWSPDDFTEVRSDDNGVYRFPKQDTALYRQMLAAAPGTYIAGYRRAIEHAVPQNERKQTYLLYWGMSTGGAFLYPMAKYIKPDGYLGWGTSSIGLAYAYRKANQGDLSAPCSQAGLRLRERGLNDFIRYTRALSDGERLRWWRRALKSPRFKTGEDALMQFNTGALTELALRLWMSDWLPARYRQQHLGGFIQDILEPGFAPAALKGVPILDMNGTLDEAIPPEAVDAHRQVLAPYAGKYRVARVRNFHHYLFTQDSIKIVGSLWLRFIESGYFDTSE